MFSEYTFFTLGLFQIPFRPIMKAEQCTGKYSNTLGEERVTHTRKGKFGTTKVNLTSLHMKHYSVPVINTINVFFILNGI